MAGRNPRARTDVVARSRMDNRGERWNRLPRLAALERKVNMSGFEIEIDVDNVVAIGDAAALLEIDGDEHWIPFSQIEDNGEELVRGYSGSLFLSQWICEQKGIEI